MDTLLPWQGPFVTPANMIPGPLAQLDRPASPAQFGRVQLWTLALLIAVTIAAGSLGGIHHLTAQFMREQDLVVALVFIVAAMLIGWQQTRLEKLWPRQGLSAFRIGALLAFGVFFAGVAGSYAVFGSFPLSLDEFWARADGEILARGVPLAQIPQEWRDFAPALQPIFTRMLPEEGLWASSYLPVNAAIQRLLGPFASPLMSAGSLVLAAMIARKLMPDLPAAPIMVAVLMATSAQLVVTAMTPYAMAGHLFFNLAWLWLLLQRKPWATLLSLLPAMLAMGLHQSAFFPLFALPFLLERFLAGERIFACLYVVAIGAGFLAWGSYDLFAYAWFGAQPVGGDASGLARQIGILIERVTDGGMLSLALMGANLLRFALWQNPVVVPLILLAAWPIARLSGDAPRELRAMLVGLVGAAIFMTLIIPLQGHGWGYRYLHGCLGSAALLAAFAFGRLTNPNETAGWKAILVGMTAVAVLLLPVRAWQAHSFAAPYIAADRTLNGWDAAGEGAAVIIIDASAHAFASDLVRNDPWLEKGAKRMDARVLTPEQFDRLCQNYRVRIFADRDAAQAGISLLPEGLRRGPRFPEGCPQ